MQMHTLEAKTRTTGRKGLNTQARVNGSIPSVLYGEGKPSVPMIVNRKILEKILHREGGAHAVIQIDFSDAAEHNSPVIVKAIQYHPVNDSLLHVDFLRIRLDQRIQSPVAIVLTGRSKGVVDGGVVDQQLREVLVECLALEIPEHIEIDITELDMGDAVHVADLKVPDGVTIITDDELTIASVHMPRVVKTEEEEAAEALEGEGEGEGEGEEGATKEDAEE